MGVIRPISKTDRINSTYKKQNEFAIIIHEDLIKKYGFKD